MLEEELAQLTAIAEKCAAASLWSATDDALVEYLSTLQQAIQAASAAQLHVIREIDGRGLPAAQHASSTAVWLREQLRVTIYDAKRKVELARAVDERPALDSALIGGAVNVEQASVIAATVHQVSADVGADQVDEAEAALIQHAGSFEPTILRKLGDRILEHIAPGVRERKLQEALKRQEARAQQSRAFQLTRRGDGRVRLSGWLDEAGAAIVNAALDPLCAPRHDHEPRTPAQRRADALVEICELAIRTEELPDNGGERPHVVVTVPFDLVQEQLGIGMLDTGGHLTPERVRQMACDANLIPAVLGGDGQVLDLGRSRRLFTGPIRRALELRDHGCAFPGCDRPPRWCHGHHIRSWADGGETSLANGVLLCGHHHRVIHRGHWTVRIAADGMPEFIPPAYVDPQRRPRRNLYHRQT